MDLSWTWLFIIFIINFLHSVGIHPKADTQGKIFPVFPPSKNQHPSRKCSWGGLGLGLELPWAGLEAGMGWIHLRNCAAPTRMGWIHPRNCAAAPGWDELIPEFCSSHQDGHRNGDESIPGIVQFPPGWGWFHPRIHPRSQQLLHTTKGRGKAQILGWWWTEWIFWDSQYRV